LYVGAIALESILFQKEAETVFLGGKIVNIAFQTAAIEEGDDSLVSVIRTVWPRRAGAIFL